VVVLGKGDEVMNGRDYTIKLNAYECGVLMGVIMNLDDRNRRALQGVWGQLATFKRQVEEEAGVTKEILPGGTLKLTDKDGTVIIREPYPFETEGN